MRRILTTVSLAYLIVAFLFILLTMVNGSDQGSFVALAEGDAGLIVALSVFGLLAVVALGVRILIDDKRREDLERHVREPRRKSQARAIGGREHSDDR